jgi:glutamate--cysteine ligase
MPRVGNLGLDMMLRTCTIQVNLDYCSEANMAKKFRVGLALQPLATALFANSPFTEGKPNGMLSYRSHIWSDTDPHRTGMLPFVFDDGFGYERYVDYMLDVPMYFVFRDGKYIDAAGRASAISSPASFPRFRASCRAERLDRPPLDRVPRSPLKRSSRCAAPTAARGTASARCRRCGSGCSTTMPRSMRRGTWSSTGRWTSARRCAAPCPARARRADPRRRQAARPCREVAADRPRRARRARRLSKAGDSEAGFLEPLEEIVASGKVPGAAPARQVPRRVGRRHRRVYEESF